MEKKNRIISNIVFCFGYLLLNLHFTDGTVTVTHTGTPYLGQSFMMTCTITSFSGTATWAHDGTTHATCGSSFCSPTSKGNYTFSYSGSTLSVTIEPILSSDQGTWQCTHSSGSDNYVLNPQTFQSNSPCDGIWKALLLMIFCSDVLPIVKILIILWKHMYCKRKQTPTKPDSAETPTKLVSAETSTKPDSAGKPASANSGGKPASANSGGRPTEPEYRRKPPKLGSVDLPKCPCSDGCLLLIICVVVDLFCAVIGGVITGLNRSTDGYCVEVTVIISIVLGSFVVFTSVEITLIWFLMIKRTGDEKGSRSKEPVIVMKAAKPNQNGPNWQPPKDKDPNDASQ